MGKKRTELWVCDTSETAEELVNVLQVEFHKKYTIIQVPIRRTLTTPYLKKVIKI